ncbi:MAG: hypothetical protein Sylvanvirus22_6 [Sylvanvirus sp.]|uniref:Uncharacterized protein n=1 Tax=Sylvanvirus sp. TaxID=2487774 RepID=A0A3G5AIP1_9VIRU|nr:MAG: hypothetical protein Sylvanvirus22_6 [Sylvanvirus sp.]
MLGKIDKKSQYIHKHVLLHHMFELKKILNLGNELEIFGELFDFCAYSKHFCNTSIPFIWKMTYILVETSVKSLLRCEGLDDSSCQYFTLQNPILLRIRFGILAQSNQEMELKKSNNILILFDKYTHRISELANSLCHIGISLSLFYIILEFL